MIRISIYDDSVARRDSLKSLILLTTNYELLGEYANCANILEEVKNTKPDIILMDIEMPDVNGIEGVRLVKKNFNTIKILMQTAFDDDEKVFAALQAGADGYLLKSASVSQILQGIDDVMQGGAAMSPSIALKVMRYFSQQQTAIAIDYDLSPKEKEVLKNLAQGLSYKMIADSMGISYFTVNNHIKKIYEKLQVHSLGEAVALAHKNKIV
jgi:DNA-binding NarL/FixJ family response regulator